MACDTPYYVSVPGRLQDVPVPCGKCPPCKKRRVQSWVFRMQQEEKVSLSAHFITLTYDTRTVPITEKGYMTLCKRDVQLFMKRLRKLEPNKLKYYFVGEYGSKGMRPHYHAIIYNMTDIENVNRAWQLGQVHVGCVSGASIAYTTKYIDKQSKVPQHRNDDRVPEFSLMSKGLGKNYISDAITHYHRADLSRNFLTNPGGYRIALPRYYREKLLTEEDKVLQRQIIKSAVEKADQDARRLYEHQTGKDYDDFIYSTKAGRYHSFYKNQKRDL